MMKKWIYGLLVAGCAMITLVACSAAPQGDAAPAGSSQTAEEMPSARLDDSYENALSVSGQLALGTVRLEETETAVDATQAVQLLPLWQALQSLRNSSNTAAVELEAVVNQIQDGMTPSQLNAIRDMKLTNDSLMELIENGELAFAGGPFGGAAGDRFPPGAEGGFPGGRPGAFPGGGPGGGGFPGGGPAGGRGGGFAGGFGADLSQEDLATRRAELESGEVSRFQERALLGMVVRVLAQKTGETLDDGRFNFAGTIFDLVAEPTGLTVDEIRSQLAEGVTLAEIIEANGGDVSQIRDQMIATFSELPNVAELDLEPMVDQWLNGANDQP